MIERPTVKVTLALLARYAEVDPASGLLNIVGGSVDVFGVARFPVEFPMGFAIQFRYPPTQSGVAKRVTLATLDPSLQVVGQPTTFEVTPQLSEFHAEGWQGVFAVTGSIDLTVEAEGAHSVGIRIDDRESGDIPFQVFLVDGKEADNEDDD